MNKFFLVGVVLAVIISSVVGYETLALQHPMPLSEHFPSPIDSYVLFPTGNDHFSVIGSYLSDSEYAMSEIYGNFSTLMVSPFMWNVKSSLGNVNMTYYHFLRVTANLSMVKKITPSISVLGYPGLMYGSEPWFPFATSTQQVPKLELPRLVGQLPDFYSVLNYSLFNKTGEIVDFSYDIWLTPEPNVTYLGAGDLEIMFWMWYTQNLSHVRYYAYEGTLDIPTFLNGTLENYPWSVYVLNYSADGWTLMVFTSSRQLQGSVGIPIGWVLKESTQFLYNQGWRASLSAYYLDAIQVGMEFNNAPNGSVDVGYNLYQWYLNFNSTEL